MVKSGASVYLQAWCGAFGSLTRKKQTANGKQRKLVITDRFGRLINQVAVIALELEGWR